MNAPFAHSGAVNPFTSGRWTMEARPQNFWGLNHATWFYAMGLGGALFILHALTGRELGRVLGMGLADVLSLVVVGIGGLILLADLGRPLQAWKVYRNPRRSWISIGFIADLVFLAVGGLWTLAELELGGARPFAGLPWAGGGALGIAFQVVAGAAAVVVIMYPGIVMASSPAIPFWNNMLIPAQFFAFAFASALGVEGLTLLWRGAEPATRAALGTSAPAVVAAAGLLLLLHVLNGAYAGSAARASSRRLVRGDLRLPFYGGLALAVVLPLALLLAAGVGTPGLALAGVSLQLGNWLTKYAVIKAGVYPPFL